MLHGANAIESTGKKAMSSNVDPKMIVAYIGCAFLMGSVFHQVADQEFSSVLTMSVFAQCLSFVLIGMQINNAKSVAGISGKTMIMQALALCFRLSSTLFLDGYLPLDRTGDMMYQIVDVCSLLMVLHILQCVYKSHRPSYEQEFDSMDVKNMVIGCVGLAVICHPDLNDWAAFDIAWTVSLYLDTVAMLPQLFMSAKVGKVPAYTSHYIAATLVSRAFSAWFWYYGAENIARVSEGFSFGAAGIIVAHVVQFLILADFGYFYLKACFSGAVCKCEPVEVSNTIEI